MAHGTSGAGDTLAARRVAEWKEIQMPQQPQTPAELAATQMAEAQAQAAERKATEAEQPGGVYIVNGERVNAFGRKPGTPLPDDVS